MNSLYATPIDDDYGTCRETFVTLRLYTGSIHPDEVTKRLKLDPDETQIKGRLKGPRKVKVNGWFFRSKGHVNSKDTRRHLHWLLETLEPIAKELQLLQEGGCSGDISCFWDSKYGHGGPTLDPDTMRRLADLNLEIWFDVYAKNLNVHDSKIIESY